MSISIYETSMANIRNELGCKDNVQIGDLVSAVMALCSKVSELESRIRRLESKNLNEVLK